jgi:hypothetical protein
MSLIGNISLGPIFEEEKEKKKRFLPIKIYYENTLENKVCRKKFCKLKPFD